MYNGKYSDLAKRGLRKGDFVTVGIFLLVVSSAVHWSCGSGTTDNADARGRANEFVNQANFFSGIKAVDKQPGNLSIVRWDPIDTPDAVYSLFKGVGQNGIDFESPFTTSLGNNFTYKPVNRYAENSLCFGVRVSNFGNDRNRKALCTEQQPLLFDGIKNLKRLESGIYVLEWEALPVDNVIYSVFDRQNDEQFNFDQPSYDGIKNNFFGGVSQIERGTKFCYVVRYRHPELAPDTNKKELCTSLEAPIEFDGVGELTALGGGKIKATWKLSKTPDVKNYRLYQGSDFREVVATVDSNTQEAVIQGLVPGRQYNIGVRAADSYQREDRNIQVRAIVVP